MQFVPLHAEVIPWAKYFSFAFALRADLIELLGHVPAI